MKRHALSPAEFDAACRELLRRCPQLSETSGKRSAQRNTAKGGKAGSKHLIGMARDFVAESGKYAQANETARSLGLWTLVHDVGSGHHLHVQGLAPGPVPQWWAEKYGG